MITADLAAADVAAVLSPTFDVVNPCQIRASGSTAAIVTHAIDALPTQPTSVPVTGTVLDQCHSPESL